MNPTTKTILTPDGKRKLEQELLELRQGRPAVLVEVNQARAQGDLRENSAYQANKEKLRDIDRRITRLELMLRRSVVVEKSASDEVQLGSALVVMVNGMEKEYHLVGETEADPKSGKISLNSPLGKAFMGKKAGQTVPVITPMGEQYYTIKSVN